MSDKSGTGTPAISLPKGGGAVKGIGETFKPNLFTGTANSSVPIATSPGREGFGPELSLQYSSGNGNGPFGVGWSLSIPQVARKTERGIPRYGDDDVFVLSGSEDLVPISDVNVPDHIIDGITYEVTRYQPRIEGLFARIESWRRKPSSSPDPRFNDWFWRITTKANVTSIFGRTAAAVVSNPASPQKIFQWLLELTYDSKGNYIHYAYRQEDGVGISKVGNERNRSHTQTYIKRILYGNLLPLEWENSSAVSAVLGGPLDEFQHLFMVLFDYGEHGRQQGGHEEIAGDIHRADLKSWDVRGDAFSSCRPGFELRTHRRVKRVLTLHNRIPTEAGPVLVRSTDFSYLQDPNTQQLMLADVTQRGYRKAAATGVYQSEEVALGKPGVVSTIYHIKSIPPLEFRYAKFHPQKQRYQPCKAKGSNMPPAGLNHSNFTLVDLFGTGLPDVLELTAAGTKYWRNLGNAQFDRPLPLRNVPAGISLGDPGVNFGDMNGNGMADLLVHGGEMWGFWEASGDSGWKKFHPYRSRPSFSLTDPNVRLVDVTGDGRSDVLRTDDHHFTIFPCLGEDGFGPPFVVERVRKLEEFPDVFFADPRVRLADMNGDGLQDIVLVHDGRIEYYPNLGYGRFGMRIAMEHAPEFGYGFDPERLFFADIDGTGCADLVYVESRKVRFWFNQSGNRWSDEHAVTGTPQFSDRDSVRVVDMLGNGATGVLWSTEYQGSHQSNYLYLDFTGGTKPYVLTEVDNNMGTTTAARYASSVQEYLADLLERRPWLTTLPFPVQVLKEVEVVDHISRSRLVTTYRYHHGSYDGREREFRGFAMVEQTDTEEFASDANVSASGTDNFNLTSYVPPVLTKTWFHTGILREGGKISRHLEREYYREPGLSEPEFQRLLLPDTILPPGLSIQERLEACRALKGSILRQEVFAKDGTPKAPHPYKTSERSYTVRCLHRKGPNPHAVFFTHAREAVESHYERTLVPRGAASPNGPVMADPRVSHELTLKVDPFGNVERAITIGYARRAVPQREPEQVHSHAIATISRFAYRDDQRDWYRAGLPVESRTYEVLRPAFPLGATDGPVEMLTFKQADDLVEQLELAGASVEIPYADWEGKTASTTVANRRLVEHVRTLYRKDDLTGPLPLDQIESRGLPFESYKLAFTPSLLSQLYLDSATGLGRVSNAMLLEGGYVHFQGDSNWWVPSGQVFYSPGTGDTPAQELPFARSHFFLPHRFRDPFGSETAVAYDPFDLLLTRITDPVNNTVQADNDYRVLQPWQVTGPNGDRSAVAFDALGMVVGTAVMGRTDETEGDSLAGFEADLTQAEVDAFSAAPRAQAVTLLGAATTRIVYDAQRFHRFRDYARPVYSATVAREVHASDLSPGQQSPLQISLTFADGVGREVQKKAQAEPDPASALGGVPSPRWVGSGWMIYNNKGKPVKRYEPFFSASHDFEFANRIGVSATLFYDPLERVVSTLHPNHTYEKVVFDAWKQETWDVNDTVNPTSRYDPRAPTTLPDHRFNPVSDPDVGHFFARLLEADYLPTWYDIRMDPAKSLDVWPDAERNASPIAENAAIRAAERKAAQRAAQHAGTPSSVHFDNLGRTFLTVTDNGLDATGTGRLYESRLMLDIEGNQRRVQDAKMRMVMEYAYDMLGNRVSQLSMDAGARWLLNDVAGKPLYRWDSRGHRVHHEYDALRRPTLLWLQQGGNPDLLVERTVYGEHHPHASALKIRGRTFLQLDAAGAVTSQRYDYKGNLLVTTRKLARAYTQQADWRTAESLLGATALDLAGIASTLAPLLESDIFTLATSYDALNRPVALTLPENTVVRPRYNEANLLNQVDADLRGASTSTAFVTNVAYNAKGQRVAIAYGNGVTTTYEFDPLTFRLAHLHSLRGGTVLQDLRYCYDPVGNITGIRDSAQQTLFYNNQVVPPSCDYLYDALYHLIGADGREHIGQLAQPQSSWDDAFRVHLPLPSDGQAMRRYTEKYDYDEVGNIQSIVHHLGNLPASGNGFGPRVWTRAYTYNESSFADLTVTNNALSSTTVSGRSEPYSYDAHGNMNSMSHLPAMTWDFKDQLRMSQRQVSGSAEQSYYVYGQDGQRVRRITIRQNGTVLKERVYIGGFELYREYDGPGTVPILERETVHIMDNKSRVAIVESKTVDRAINLRAATVFNVARLATRPVTASLIRYQLGNHLGSACFELDQVGKSIGYEEYYPYGCTSYQAVNAQVEVARRYRFSAKERDEESGLYYHGARYFSPWLSRWTSCDPLGTKDGLNLYWYALLNPIRLVDTQGFDSTDQVDITNLQTDQAGNVTDREVRVKNFERVAKPWDTAKGCGALTNEGIAELTEAARVKGPGRLPRLQTYDRPKTEKELKKYVDINFDPQRLREVLAYIKGTVDEGFPVFVGVNEAGALTYKIGNPTQLANDSVTDHYLAVIGYRESVVDQRMVVTQLLAAENALGFEGDVRNLDPVSKAKIFPRFEVKYNINGTIGSIVKPGNREDTNPSGAAADMEYQLSSVGVYKHHVPLVLGEMSHAMWDIKKTDAYPGAINAYQKAKVEAIMQAADALSRINILPFHFGM